MATVTGFTAARMEAIENASVVDGEVVGDNLILTRFDATTINAGNVRGPTGSPGVTSGELSDELAKATPIGGIIEYIGETSPYPNWLAMTGQTVTNAQTLYPVWWSRLPASMKSGANAIMPDTRGRVTVGLNTGDTDFNTSGKLGGAKTHTLDTTQIPSHAHAGPSHQHALANHVHGGPNHNHVVGAHAHGPGNLATGTDSPPHRHWLNASGHAGGRAFAIGQGMLTGVFVEGAGGTGVKGTAWEFAQNTYYPMEEHTHGVVSGATSANSDFGTGQGGTGNTGFANPNLSDSSGTANTANTGGGLAHNNLQPYITFMKIVRVE